jgi:hypothetical protein
MNAIIGLMRGSLSYAVHTQQFNEFIITEVSTTASYGRHLVRSFHQWVGEFSASYSDQVPSFPTGRLQHAASVVKFFLNDLVTN